MHSDKTWDFFLTYLKACEAISAKKFMHSDKTGISPMGYSFVILSGPREVTLKNT